MEQLGHYPKLANSLEAKRRMGLTNKTDKLDAKGLAICSATALFQKFGFRPGNCGINAN